APRATFSVAGLLRAAALSLLVASGTVGTAFAAPTAATDPLSPLTAAYDRAVRPGDEVQTYRELFHSVLQRVQRTYAQEVDLAPLVEAGVKALAPLEPQSTEPAAAFKKAINASLKALDPHSNYLDAREQRDERGSLSGGFGGLGMQV